MDPWVQEPDMDCHVQQTVRPHAHRSAASPENERSGVEPGRRGQSAVGRNGLAGAAVTRSHAPSTHAPPHPTSATLFGRTEPVGSLHSMTPATACSVPGIGASPVAVARNQIHTGFPAARSGRLGADRMRRAEPRRPTQGPDGHPAVAGRPSLNHAGAGVAVGPAS
jgi:hypothetical protein